MNFRSRHRALRLLALAWGGLAFTLAAALAVPPPPPPANPPAGHPRLLVRPHHLAAVRDALADPTPALDAAWTELQRRAHIPADYRPAPRYDLALMRAAEANAFISLIEQDHDRARRAIDLAFALLGDAGPDTSRGYHGRQAIGTCLFNVAKVYDWCHAAMTPAERERLCALLREHATAMEIKFPPVTPGSIVGHSSGSQLLKDQLAMAIATFDEDPEIWDLVAGRFYAEYVAPREFFYPGGFHHQGNAYGAGRFDCEVWAALLITRMGLPSPWNLGAMGQVPYYFLYLRRPDGGFIKDGDDYYGSSRPVGSYWTPPTHRWLRFAGLFRDPQFAAQWHRQLDSIEIRFSDRDEPVDPVLTILLRPDAIDPAYLTSLPLARYFPEPLGAILARTGWDIGPDSRDAAAYLKIGTHRFENHQHADSGQFQLFYRGSLALDSGIYESRDTGYGRPHHRNYFRRAIAHNTLLIEEPTESFDFVGEPIVNDGGQRSIDPPETMEDFWAAPTRTGRMLAHYIGPDPQTPEVSLIKGDLTAAYADTKARQVTRLMAFLPLDDSDTPAALVVLDRVESIRPDQRKAALLHSQEEPVITGHITTVRRTGGTLDVQRHPAIAIEQADPRSATVRLTFDLGPLAGRTIQHAELLCRPPWSLQGSLRVTAADRTLAELKLADSLPTPLPDVTAWLRDALASGQSRAHLTATLIDGDTRGVLGPRDRPFEPHLRVWVATTPSDGKLVQTTLLPKLDDLDLRKVGGPGAEFMAGGENWPATPNLAEPMGGVEAGAWRVEVSQRSAATVNHFLNVYHVMDGDATPATAGLREGPGWVGAAFSGRLLVASTAAEPLPTGTILEIRTDDTDRNGETLVVLTDLPPGDHSLWTGDRLFAAGVVETGESTWVTKLRPGTYELRSR